MKFSYFRKSLAGLIAAAALMALVAPGAAATAVPEVGYEKFTGCPHPGQNPSIVTCFREVISGGELQIGNVEIPISKPITLSGGITGAGEFDFNTFGGLSLVKQTVPGGVIGFTGLTWLAEFFGEEALELYAEIRLVNKPSNQLEEPAALPVRVSGTRRRLQVTM